MNKEHPYCGNYYCAGDCDDDDPVKCSYPHCHHEAEQGDECRYHIGWRRTPKPCDGTWIGEIFTPLPESEAESLRSVLSENER